MEIDQQPNLKIQQSQVSQRLGFVKRVNRSLWLGRDYAASSVVEDFETQRRGERRENLFGGQVGSTLGMRQGKPFGYLAERLAGPVSTQMLGNLAPGQVRFSRLRSRPVNS